MLRALPSAPTTSPPQTSPLSLKTQCMQEGVELCPLPEDIFPAKPPPLGAKPLRNGSSSSPAQAALPTAPADLCLVPAAGDSARSCATDRWRSLGSVPKLSAPAGSPVVPQPSALQGQTLNHQKSRGAGRDASRSLERSWRRGAWFPASKPPRLDTNRSGHLGGMLSAPPQTPQHRRGYPAFFQLPRSPGSPQALALGSRQSQIEAAQAPALASASRLPPSLLAPSLPGSPEPAPAERGNPGADICAGRGAGGRTLRGMSRRALKESQRNLR